MLRINEIHSVSVVDNDLIVNMIGQDNKKYEMALSQPAASSLLANLLQAAKSLPNNLQENPILDCSLQIAVDHQDMKPLLVIGFGGLEIAAKLQEQQFASLHNDIVKLASSTSTSH